MDPKVTASIIPMIPTWFWVAAGMVFVTNLGTFGTLLTFIWRASWWASKVDSRIEKAQDTGVRAHRRIDKFETKLEQRSTNGIS